MANVLTAFFSLTGQTYGKGGMVELDKGYTHMAAEFIAEATGCDLFHIEQVREYSVDHMVMIREAKEELDGDMRPAIKDFPASIDGYDTVVVAYPNWWNALPMPVVTFLTHFSWAGKTVVPFCTSGGGGFGHSREDLAKYCLGAVIAEGMTIPGAEVEDNKEIIQTWAKARL